MEKRQDVMPDGLSQRIPQALWWVIGIALIVRLVVMVFLPDQHFPDSGSYRTAGEQFRHLHLMTNTDIMPLYPLLIAVVGDGWGQRFADLLLSVATVWVVFALSIRIFRDQAAALATGLACALWPHFIFFSAVGLTETLFIALTLGAFLCLYDERYLAGSILLVLSILTRPALEPFAFIAIPFFALFVHRRPIRFALKRLAIYVLVYIGLMAPWWLHNYAYYSTFVRLNLGGGMVLYTGNNPANLSGGGIAGRDVDFTEFKKIADPVKKNEAFQKAAIGYIKAEPGHFVAMLPVKFLRLWRPWPYTDEYRNPVIVAISVASFLPAICLAAFGLAATVRRNFRPLSPCLIYVVFLTLVHVITIGSVRYRIPMEPIVLILAGAGLVILLRRVAWGQSLLMRLQPATSVGLKS